MILGVALMPSGVLVTLTEVGGYHQTQVYVADPDSERDLTTAEALEWLRMMRDQPLDGAFWPGGLGNQRP